MEIILLIRCYYCDNKINLENIKIVNDSYKYQVFCEKCSERKSEAQIVEVIKLRRAVQ